MNSTVKTLLLWVFIFVVVILLFNTFKGRTASPEQLSYSELLTELENQTIDKVTIAGQVLTGRLKTSARFPDGAEFTAQARITDGLVEKLEAADVLITFEEPRESTIFTMLIGWAPLLVLVGLWVFFMRQMQTGGNRAMSFGKSKAKLLNSTGKKVSFKDVAGIEEAKDELMEIVDFLKDPQRFQKLGGKIPKGVLLMGPPGTGKTLLARAIAGEANVPFFSISGSDFVEMFVGVGASRVRDLFDQGKKNAPCLIFIDEIDAVGRHRGAGLGGGHDEREQTLNQLLVEMDGFESNEGVILIAATNRPDVLDPALLRPGRFDRRVVVPRPDLRGRVAILRVHTRRVPLGDDVKLEVLGRGTPGMVGADLQNLVNEAALLAARRDANHVVMDDFEAAKDKVLMGSERRSLIMSDEEKRITAYHEGGHALVAALTEQCDPVHKVTIIPRGLALGLTQILPEEDRHNHTREQMVAIIKYAMGGRAAEEVVFDQLSTGAANDLQKATSMARDMVCHYGMSDRIGPVSFDDGNHDVFLGRDFVTKQTYSEATAQEIDEEVKKLLRELYDEAKQLLADNRGILDQIAEALLERETLERRDMELLLAGEPLPPLPLPVAEPVEEPAAAAAAASEDDSEDVPDGNLPDPEPIPG